MTMLVNCTFGGHARPSLSNPRDDMKSITNTVAKAMIDSLVHDDLVLKSGTIYVTVMVRYDGMSDGIRVYP
jgi:hypothetical protein